MVDITEYCAYCRNYFAPKSKKKDGSYKHSGTFAISGHTIEPLDFLVSNQYFRIVGSDLNEGVYCNTTEGMGELQDETFTGEIWEMAVPRAFLALCQEIENFNAKVDEMALVDKGYASESFGGYSYSLSSQAPASMLEWQARIKRRMNSWQRIYI